ncbi:hypothetical protein D2962_14250 [Biomaibacter acetigenes]|jgi:hypothetical protein|uniref:Uncharacterized protein n=1 Tax=Biomaibacter acetigenes TaxID=2316383 RepID=A0A3G2RA54_9FIRM|nr:hypothetical protein D2962_14250 [Biomaibacter acetigenes]
MGGVFLKKDSQKKKNEFEKDMEDLQDWLDNQYNPGHYVGTGRVPRPIGRLTKYPLLLIIFGLLYFAPVIIVLVSSKFTCSSLISSIIPVLISIGFIIGGIQKYSRMRNRKKSEK